MAQADGVVANGTGSAVRSDINTQYAALWSNHSGSTEPSSGKVAYQFWADTNTSILKIRNSANNAWINLFTLAGGIDVDAASIFNEDVTFTGASYNLVWDKSDNALEFADNGKCTFGGESDLSLYHDGNDSYIKDSGTGNLKILANSLEFKSTGDGEHTAKFTTNGSCELYHNDSKKLETTSAGITVTGSVTETSDVSLKNDINTIQNPLELIEQIRGINFTWKNNGMKSMGVIAQDVEKVFPELVHGQEGSKTLQYSGLIGALVESIKELSAKVTALEAK